MSRIKPLFLSDVPPSLRDVPIPSVPSEPVINAIQPPVTPPVVVADAKSPLKSKINWLGIILTLIGALQLVQEGPLLDTLIPDQDTRAKVSAVVLFLGGILTVVLRSFFTYRPTTVTTVTSNVE